MREIKIIGGELPNIPRNPAQGVSRVFNSAVVSHEGRFVGVFRAETINGRPHLHLGASDDGVHWTIEEGRIRVVAVGQDRRGTLSD